jgi:alpha-beta hydrolase superfamily lysophospholipase
MRHVTFEFGTAGLGRLFGQGWLPEEQSIVAVVALVHGIGEHSGRYDHVGRWYAERGIALLAYDQVGHGRSPGRRGHIPSYEDVLNGIHTFLEQARSIGPDIPLFLYGHSLGGNYVVNYAMRREEQLAGVIVTSPWLELVFQPPAWKLALSKVLAKVWPSLTQSSGINRIPLTRDPNTVLQNPDLLVHDRISVNLYTSASSAAEWALARPAGYTFPYPVLFMHGDADAITSPQATSILCSRMNGEITYQEWPGYYHELHNEKENESIFEYVYRWIQNELTRGAI